MRSLMRRSAQKAAALVAALLLAAGPCLPTTAHAATPGTTTMAVSGVDSLEPSAESWELLRVDNYDGEPIYIDVTRTEGGEATLLMSRQPYTLEGTTDDGEPVAHVVSISLGGTTPADAYGNPAADVRYGVAVHTSARGGETLYEGTVYPVYAQLLQADGSVGDRRFLGIRTASAQEAAAGRNIGLGSALYGEGGDDRAAWALDTSVNGTPGRDNRFVADEAAFVGTYRKAESGSVTGSVSYVDREGTTVRTDTFPGVGTEGMMVPVEQSFFSDGVYYRVLSGLSGSTTTLTAANPHRVVRVVPVDGADANAYQVTVRYVTGEGEDERLLWSDSVDVRGDGFRYTLPDAFSMGGTDGVSHYRLQSVDGGASGREWGNPLMLTGDLVPADFGAAVNGARTLTARYESSEVSKEAVFTVVEVDGSTSEEIGRVSHTVTPGRDAVYEPASRVVDGVTLHPAAVNAGALIYRWDDLAAGRDLVAYVYYVPEGWTAGSPYDIEVRSVDVGTGSVIGTSSHRVDPEMTDYLRVVGDERITADGETYVRLPGQEAGISHSFFSPARTYTVYYRNVDDTLNANTVVRRTQVIETDRVVTLPGETVVVRGSVSAVPTTVVTTGPAAAILPVAGGDGAPAVEAGVTPGDGTVIVNDDDNPLATLEGSGTTQERIDDDGTPLAGPGSGAASAAVAVGGSLAAVAALAALLYLFVKRKKKADTSGSQSE